MWYWPKKAKKTEDRKVTTITKTSAERAEMMLITMVVTMRHLLPLAPPMAIPPETQKNADKNIKGRE